MPPNLRPVSALIPYMRPHWTGFALRSSGGSPLHSLSLIVKLIIFRITPMIAFKTASIVAILTFIFIVIAILIHIKNGWSFTLDKVRLSGFNLDAYNFHQLSPVIEYANISRIAVMNHSLEARDIDRFTLIYIGWGLIADAYIERFREYPSEDSLDRNVLAIGSQNREFIRVFQRVYTAGSKVTATSKIQEAFAYEYFGKSTGLAERIATGGDRPFNAQAAVEKKLRATGYDKDYRLLDRSMT